MDRNAIFGLTDKDYSSQKSSPRFYVSKKWGKQRPPQHEEVVIEGEIIDCPNTKSVNFVTNKDDLEGYKVACWTQLNNRNQIRLDMLRRNPRTIPYCISEETLHPNVWTMFTDKKLGAVCGTNTYYVDMPEGDRGDIYHLANGFTSAIRKYTRIMELLGNPWRIFIFSYDGDQLLYVGKYPTYEAAMDWIYERGDGKFQIREFNVLKYNVLIQGDQIAIDQI